MKKSKNKIRTHLNWGAGGLYNVDGIVEASKAVEFDPAEFPIENGDGITAFMILIAEGYKREDGTSVITKVFY